MNPGVVKTRFQARAGIVDVNPAASHPIGRIGRPEEIAAAIGYLAGDDATFVTGTCLVVDGGVSVKTKIE